MVLLGLKLAKCRIAQAKPLRVVVQTKALSCCRLSFCSVDVWHEASLNLNGLSQCAVAHVSQLPTVCLVAVGAARAGHAAQAAHLAHGRQLGGGVCRGVNQICWC